MRVSLSSAEAPTSHGRASAAGGDRGQLGCSSSGAAAGAWLALLVAKGARRSDERPGGQCAAAARAWHPNGTTSDTSLDGSGASLDASGASWCSATSATSANGLLGANGALGLRLSLAKLARRKGNLELASRLVDAVACGGSGGEELAMRRQYESILLQRAGARVARR